MNANPNLTDDQQRRIEGATTSEEKVRILAESMDGTELTDDQLEGVSGGDWMPSTREEMRQALDTVKSIINTYGRDVAIKYCRAMNYYDFSETDGKAGNMLYWLHRKWIHQFNGDVKPDGSMSLLDHYSC